MASKALYKDCTTTTGWGAFDLDVKPPGLLTVKIKVFFEVDPTLKSKVNVVDFLSKWQEAVSKLWDNKIKLQPQDNSNQQLLVKFQMTKVDELDQAHFPVFIKPGGYAAGAGVYFPDKKRFGGKRMFLKLGELDNMPYHQGAKANISGGSAGSRAGMFLSQTDRVMDVIPGNNPSIGVSKPYSVKMNKVLNSWAIDPQHNLLIDQLCSAIQQTPPWLPQPPVRISAESGKAGKATAIVDRIAQRFRSRGVMNVSIVESAANNGAKFRNPFRKTRTTAEATIEILPTAEMVKRLTAGMAVADNVVSAHEFGHLLGLPDEYLNYSKHMKGSQVMVKSQPEWNRLCNLHNPKISIRQWDDAYNGSMMSVGTTIHPAHAITIWYALEQASQIKWKIISP